MCCKVFECQNVIYCKSNSCYSAITLFQAFIDIFDIELYLLPCALSSVGKAISRVPHQNTAKLTVLGKHRRSGAAPHTSPLILIAALR